jgi:tRNA pseudouridine55 synthase
MAEGLLLVLVGSENNEREKYIGLDKTYQVEILFGISTDTLDTLGIVQEVVSEVDVKEENIINAIEKFKGEIEQKYPDFSSKTVNGKPLFLYAREGLDVPKVEHSVFVSSIKFVKYFTVSSDKLFNKIKKSVLSVVGDFRQEEIVREFEEKLSGQKIIFSVLSLEMRVSSGFYVRQFAEDLGKELGLPAVTLSIKRSSVGDFDIKDCVL